MTDAGIGGLQSGLGSEQAIDRTGSIQGVQDARVIEIGVAPGGNRKKGSRRERADDLGESKGKRSASLPKCVRIRGM